MRKNVLSIFHENNFFPQIKTNVFSFWVKFLSPYFHSVLVYIEWFPLHIRFTILSPLGRIPIIFHTRTVNLSNRFTETCFQRENNHFVEMRSQSNRHADILSIDYMRYYCIQFVGFVWAIGFIRFVILNI